MENNYLLSIGDEKELPVYLTYIGENEYQPHVVRPRGFYCSQIIYCTGGEGTLWVNGREYRITENAVFYLPPDVPHEYRAAEDGRWFTHYIAFDGYVSKLMMKQLGYDGACVYTVDTKALDELFRKIVFEIKSDRDYWGYMASAAVYEVIMLFHKMVSVSQNGSCPENDILEPVLQYIDENYMNVIELSCLCNIAKVTPQYLCRIFRKTVGMRPMEYITDKRIRMAKQLLVMTDMSVKEIAEKVGYSNSGYFCTVFRRTEGISPGEYQKANLF